MTVGGLQWNGSAWTGGTNVLSAGVLYEIQTVADFGSGCIVDGNSFVDAASVSVIANVGCSGVAADSHTCTFVQRTIVTELEAANDSQEFLDQGHTFTQSSATNYGDHEGVTFGDANGVLSSTGVVDFFFNVPAGKKFILGLVSVSAGGKYTITISANNTTLNSGEITTGGDKTYFIQPGNNGTLKTAKLINSVTSWFEINSEVRITIVGNNNNMPTNVKLDLIFF